MIMRAPAGRLQDLSASKRIITAAEGLQPTVMTRDRAQMNDITPKGDVPDDTRRYNLRCNGPGPAGFPTSNPICTYPPVARLAPCSSTTQTVP